MKTLIYFITGITLNILLLSSCTPESIDRGSNTCNNCNYQTSQPTYELLLEKKSPYSGFNVITATLNKDFTYPAIVNWYNVTSESRRLNKTDTLTSTYWNKSYYHFESLASGHFKVECEVIMTDGLTIAKSIDL